jgi:hypothetical protein
VRDDFGLVLARASLLVSWMKISSASVGEGIEKMISDADDVGDARTRGG